MGTFLHENWFHFGFCVYDSRGKRGGPFAETIYHKYHIRKALLPYGSLSGLLRWTVLGTPCRSRCTDKAVGRPSSKIFAEIGLKSPQRLGHDLFLLLSLAFDFFRLSSLKLYKLLIIGYF